MRKRSRYKSGDVKLFIALLAAVTFAILLWDVRRQAPTTELIFLNQVRSQWLEIDR